MANRSSDRRNLAPQLLLVVVLGVAGALGSGCTVSEPSSSDWTQTSARALESAASAVATTRLALAGRRDDDFWRSYVVVLLADAEEAAGSASEEVSVLQTPPGRQQRARRVLDLLGRAEDAVRAAREEVVADAAATQRRLDRLDRLHRRLLREAGR